jgi:hypothetical protein
MPPNEAEMEGAWVWTRWRAGQVGADWATCLRLLERAAAAAAAAVDVDVARDVVDVDVAHDVSLCSGRRTE